MSLVITSGPAIEPVTLAEAKAHLRLDGTVEDALIQSLIITARMHIEAALGLALMTQTWKWCLDRWPKGQRLSIPIRPVQSVQSVIIWMDNDISRIIPLSQFYLDGQSAPARLVWLASNPPPDPGRVANGIEISFAAGFGSAASDIPATVRHALLLLVAHWYENREPVEIGSAINAIPAMVTELLAPHRRRRP